MAMTDEAYGAYDEWRNTYWERKTPKAIAASGGLTAANFIPFDDASGLAGFSPPATDSFTDQVLWAYYSTVGPLHSATTFLARQVGRVRWDVTIDGQLQSDDKADAIIADITEPFGNRIVTEALALHFQVPGRVWYLNFPDRGWDVVAFANPDIKKLRAKARKEVFGITRHPLNPKQPDSPVRANMLTIQELALLQQQDIGQALTRIITRGILFYPNDVDFDGDFESDFKASIQQAITNPGSPTGFLPHLVAFPAEFIEKWDWLIPAFPYDEALPEKIEAVLRRLALGLDMPPEALLGIGNASHWAQWSIQESTYRAHTEPLADKVGFVLSKALMATEVGQVVTVRPDPTPLLARVGSVTDALEMYDRGIVDGEFVRDRAGAQDDDKPVETERLEQLDIGTRRPAVRRLSQDRQGPPVERTPR